MFKLIKFYDISCDVCGNWASGDVGQGELMGTKKEVEMYLTSKGWKVVEGKTICNYCAENKQRPWY